MGSMLFSQNDLFPLSESAEASKPTLTLRESPLTLPEKVKRTQSIFRDLVLQGKRCLCAFSGGKDSSVMAAILIEALFDMKQAGELDRLKGEGPRLVVVHSDTRLENPVASRFAHQECRKMQAFFDANDLPARVDIVQPGMSNNYMVALIGGRAVATMPGMSSNCSMMMKVEPITRHKRKIFKAYGKNEVFTAVGTRRDESSARAGAMKGRRDSELAPVLNKDGEWVWSPIADFDLGDIFTHIGQIRVGRGQTYSTFDELGEHYRDLNGGECMVTVYVTGQASSSGCGSRAGCYVCTKVSSDRSLVNMTKEDRFSWLKPLSDFRNYLAYHHFNPQKRRWLARTMNDDGTVAINPTAYSAAHTEDLLRYALTIQRKEYEAAEAGGFEPRYNLLREVDVIAIQVLWARYGFHAPAKALQIWEEVMIQGVDYDVPSINPEDSPYTRQDMKVAGQTSISLRDAEYDSLFSGFRDVAAATAGAERTVEKSDGTLYAEAETGAEFDIDEEGAQLFLGIELYRTLRDARSGVLGTAIYHKLVRMGVVQLKSGSESSQEKMLFMANQIERKNLIGLDSDPAALIAI
jgi:3'-phosphoadenosine 5'-phosphosulfate sulfotransferase (PAPS reductase)/FAD synthetase